MPNEKLKFTNETYTLVETGVENQLLFARNDGGELKVVSNDDFLELLAQYMLAKAREGTIDNGDVVIPHCVRSLDKTCIRVTLVVNPTAEIQHTEEEEDNEYDFNLTEKKPNFFKQLFKKLCK